MQFVKQTGKARQIAQTALELFTQRGYVATSVEQISVEAGIGKSTIYEYYQTKEELFIAAIMEASEKWAGDLKAVGQATDDPVDRLYRIVELWKAYMLPGNCGENRLFFEVMTQTFMEDGVFFNRRHIIRHIHQGLVKIIADYLLEGVSSGRLHPGIARNAGKFALNFMAFMDGLQLYALIEENYVDVEAQIDYFMRHMVTQLTGADGSVDAEREN